MHMEKEGDWFRRNREEQALREAFVSTYADEEDRIFYAVDTLDTRFCDSCRDETETAEEVSISFQEAPDRELLAIISRLKKPRFMCRECLTFIVSQETRRLHR